MMETPSSYLVRLARYIATPYAALPQSRAILLTGSTASGTADLASDIDLIAYYDALPDVDDLRAAYERNGGSAHMWLGNDRASGTILEIYDLHGVQCQVLHTTVTAWQRDMATVREQLDVTTPLHKALAGLLGGMPLHGAELIHEWQTLAANYPDALAEAVVMHHLAGLPSPSLAPYLATRDATIWHYQTMVEAAQHLLGALAGLNRVYFSTFQLKHQHQLAAQLTLAPADLAARLERLFQPDVAAAGRELAELAHETIALIETHMPTIDTAAARKRLQWQRAPWQLRSDAIA